MVNMECENRPQKRGFRNERKPPKMKGSRSSSKEAVSEGGGGLFLEQWGFPIFLMTSRVCIFRRGSPFRFLIFLGGGPPLPSPPWRWGGGTSSLKNLKCVVPPLSNCPLFFKGKESLSHVKKSVSKSTSYRSLSTNFL